jgi:hypothetical protein
MRERIREIIMQTCAEMGVHIMKGGCAGPVGISLQPLEM